MGCPQLLQISPNPWKSYDIDRGECSQEKIMAGEIQAAAACSYACFAKLKCSATSLKDLEGAGRACTAPVR